MKKYSDFIVGKKYKCMDAAAVPCIGHLTSGMPVFETTTGYPAVMTAWDFDLNPCSWSEVREPRVRYAVYMSGGKVYGMYDTKDEALVVSNPNWSVVKFVEEFE